MFSSGDIGSDDRQPGLAYPSEEVAVEAILKWGREGYVSTIESYAHEV